jgi:hypothetical protein
MQRVVEVRTANEARFFLALDQITVTRRLSALGLKPEESADDTTPQVWKGDSTSLVVVHPIEPIGNMTREDL